MRSSLGVSRPPPSPPERRVHPSLFCVREAVRKQILEEHAKIQQTCHRFKLIALTPTKHCQIMELAISGDG